MFLGDEHSNGDAEESEQGAARLWAGSLQATLNSALGQPPQAGSSHPAQLSFLLPESISAHPENLNSFNIRAKRTY